MLILPLAALSGAALAGPIDPYLFLFDNPAGISSAFAQGLSDDGNVVVGYGSTPDNDRAIRWTTGTPQPMGTLGVTGTGYHRSSADAVSRDGTAIVGSTSSPQGIQAFRYTQAGGMVGLGDLPGGSFVSWANGASNGGAVVVGHSRSGNSEVNGIPATEAFRWTEATGMVGLGDLAGGSFQSGAHAVTPDGSVIVGWGLDAQGTRAFRWTESAGMVGLPRLFGEGSRATAVSADGATIAGVSHTLGRSEATLWTPAGPIGLGDLPGGDIDSWALSISADGTRVVGFGETAAGSRGFYWDATYGMLDLNVMLQDAGVLPFGFVVTAATGVTVNADGMAVITGHGGFAGGGNQAFIAGLPAVVPVPEPGTILALGLGGLALLRRRKRN